MATSREYGATFRSLFDVIIHKESAVNFASAADAETQAVNVTVTGAALGDLAWASIAVDVADLTLDAQVTAADTVTLTVNNNTGGAVDLAAADVRIVVLQPGRLWDRV
jgi:hypothetical protein